MAGVYGTFVEEFRELSEPFYVWTLEDKSDIRLVRAIYIPNKGSGIKRRKYTSGNTSLDIIDEDDFYISRKYDACVKIGDYVTRMHDNIIMRLTGEVPYTKAAGYRIYTIERVTGSTPDKDEKLKVKEVYIA